WPRDWSSDVCSSDLSAPHRFEGAERHARMKRVEMHARQRDTDAIRLRGAQPAKAQGRLVYVSSVEAAGLSPFASCTCLSSAPRTCATCWLTIGCSTRWPIEATGPRM